MLLWLLSASPVLGALACVEAGTVQLVPASTQASATASLRTELVQGLLRLHFGGQLLRG